MGSGCKQKLELCAEQLQEIYVCRSPDSNKPRLGPTISCYTLHSAYMQDVPNGP